MGGVRPLDVLAVSLVANGLLIAAAVVLYRLFRRYQRNLYVREGRELGWPVPTVQPSALHPAFVCDELGPTPAAEVSHVGTGDGVKYSTSDREAWILSVLAKHSRTIFEFGTCTGRTSYLLARNSPPQATVTTLTLAPDQLDRYEPGSRDSREATKRAANESTFTHFRYTGTDCESKVEQRFCDSKEFDETPYIGRCDLIFIDGSHAYSYVASDTAKALRMVAPGGYVVWHDYKGPWGSARGVFDRLNELAPELPLVRVNGTTLVVYRAPQAAG